MLQPFACGVELLLRTLPSKCIARVALLPERRTNIAKLVRPTLQCFRTICCTFHSTPSRRICRAATHRISKTNVHPCPCQARRIYTPHSARSTSCDLAAQGSSRCSSGNLIAARQANLAARLRLGGYAPVSAPAQKQPLRGACLYLVQRVLQSTKFSDVFVISKTSSPPRMMSAWRIVKP